ncbi:MAG: hypothetical protein NTV81_04120 [Candidatus Komeilibacteria bacterium]|nr:hypothetical protein [Candidatus Komeilibacteria bacterium]
MEKLFLIVLLVAVIAVGFVARPQTSGSIQLTQANLHQTVDRDVSF